MLSPYVETMPYQEAFHKLQELDQQQLLQFWEELSFKERSDLLEQISSLNVALFKWQQDLVRFPKQSVTNPIEPFYDYSFSGNLSNFELGKQLIAEGKVGCLLVAGGQGTRLRISGPKGVFPITPSTKKSLFQLFAEKVIAAGKQAGRRLPLAVMTSPLNHEETVAFFKKHDLFGLDPDQVQFFSQEMLPLLNPSGDLFLETPHLLAKGPDGNGSSLRYFVEKGVWDKWHHAGVRYLNFVLVDNASADPFDAELVGRHHQQQVEVTQKCTLRRDSNEKVGVVVKSRDRVAVIEYSELSDEEKSAQLPNGDLKHRCANLSLFCFNMDFIKNATADQKAMPLHLAFKAAKYVIPNGQTITSEQPIAWKFETFIFDILQKADRVQALLYPREECFAPVKNFSGDDSPATAQQALIQQAKRAIEKITGQVAPEKLLEISQEFYYPTEELLNRWKGRAIPNKEYLDALD